MKLMATITALGEDGFYEARTNFGTICSGVHLLGNDEDHKFKVGDQVSVYQVNGGFGAFGGGHQSLLELPAGVVKDNKELAAMAYLARMAGNTKKMYDTGSVTAIDGDKVTVNGAVMPCAIDASKLYVGATVMLHVLDKKHPRVLGWWGCVPRGSGIKAVSIGRIPYSASIDMREITFVNGSYDTTNRVILTRTFYFDEDEAAWEADHGLPSFEETNADPEYQPDPSALYYYDPTEGVYDFTRMMALFLSNEYVDYGAVENYLNSEDTDEYFYTYIVMRRLWGAAHEEHWVRWHRTNYTVEEITELEYAGLAAVQPAHTKTADGKYWHYEVAAGGYGSCYTSETPDGAKTLVYYMGYLHEPQIWLPVKGHIYKPWV